MKINKLKTLLIVIIAFITISSPSFAKSVKFIQLTDIHYSPEGTTDSKRDVSRSSQNLKFAVTSINKQNADFVVFLGDNIDKSQPQSLIGFLRETQVINKPFYFVLGNHDAYKLSGIPKEEYIKAIRLYNPHQKSNKPYYTFSPNKEVIGVVVDGSMPFAPSAHGEYTDEMLTWLDKTLTKNKNKVVLIFQHFPLIPPSENRSHTTLKPDKYFDLLVKHKNVALISSGHYHDDKITIDENGIYHISAPSLLVPPNIYELIEVSYDKKQFQPPSNVKIDLKRIQI